MVKKQRIGIVVSTKMDKTVIVVVQTRYQHPKYTKTVLKTKRYMAHDEENKCKAGDIILLEETPPMSRHKKWTLKQILKVYEK
jgi:small subunit ribosomal protein S17